MSGHDTDPIGVNPGKAEDPGSASEQATSTPNVVNWHLLKELPAASSDADIVDAELFAALGSWTLQASSEPSKNDSTPRTTYNSKDIELLIENAGNDSDRDIADVFERRKQSCVDSEFHDPDSKDALPHDEAIQTRRTLF